MAKFNKREQVLIDRFKASGRDVNHEMLNVAFRFMIRPLTTVGVDMGNLASWFEDEAFSMVNARRFESRIRYLMVSPTIMDSSIAKIPPDYLKFRMGEKSVLVGMSMDYDFWSSASSEIKLDLLSDNIIASVNRVPIKHLSESDHEALLAIIEQVRSRLKSRLLN